MEKIFQKSLIVAVVTFGLDFIFHYFFTNPMESLTYFVIKFLLSFFVAVGLFSLKRFINYLNQQKIIAFISGLVFSALMSVYYRAWELGEAGAPFGSRAPNIIGIERYSILFSAVWWLAHASFFFIGALIVIKFQKKYENFR